jgi:hypothetical protein
LSIVQDLDASVDEDSCDDSSSSECTPITNRNMASRIISY